MGLDMYLEARRPFYEYMFKDEAEYPAIQKAVADTIGVSIPETFKLREIKFQAMYWRKANAIHKWFVDNVQEGKDECQESWVERANLEALLEVLRKVSGDWSLAPTLLPSQSGFFFGGTEYDEYYFEDVDATIKSLEAILAMPDFDKWDWYYQSSW